MNLNLPLSLYYETCDEDGMVDPYFTGDIVDSEGRTICRADSEGKALDLIGGFDDLLANIEALRVQLAESERRRVELVEATVHIYNSGYSAGHHYTVEGGYVDIHSSDMDTYHAEEVAGLLASLVGEEGR